jgi:hypothetical protein
MITPEFFLLHASFAVLGEGFDANQSFIYVISIIGFLGIVKGGKGPG